MCAFEPRAHRTLDTVSLHTMSQIRDLVVEIECSCGPFALTKSRTTFSPSFDSRRNVGTHVSQGFVRINLWRWNKISTL